MKKFVLHYYLFFAVILYCPYAHAQKSINFEVYSREQGLSDNFVNSIVQDKNGYVWFSTSYGVNRFDGLNFRQYVKTKENTGALLRNDINCSVLDSEGMLILGSHNGTFIRYNYVNDKFEDASLHYKTNEEYPWIYRFYKKSEHELYALTTIGLFKYDDSKHTFEKFFKDFPEISRMYVIAMYIDSHKNYWLSTADNGFIKVNLRTKQICQIPTDSKKITTFYQLNNAEFLVGTDKGVYKISDVSTPKLQPVFSELSKSYITSIISDKTGNLWIGTNYNGLWIQQKGKELYKIPKNQTQGIEIASINTLFCDNNNILWVGTQGNGVCMYNPSKNNIFHTTISDGLPINVVSCITEDKSGNLWIGTDGGGIGIFNENFNYLKTLKSPSYFNSNSILYFTKNTDNSVFISTWSGGITYMNMSTFASKSYTTANSGISDNLLKSSYLVDNSKIWIGTHGHGISEYNIQTNSFRTIAKFPPFPSGYNNQLYVNELIKAKNGSVWVATIRNLYMIQGEKSKSILDFDNQKNPHYPLFVHTVCEDKQGNILAGTNKGMFKISADGNTIIDFSKYIPELKNSGVSTILVDSKNNYWIAGTMGLYVYNSAKKTYQLCVVDNYTQGNFFTPRAAFEDRSGRIHLGTINGLYSFYPDSIFKKQEIQNFIFSNLYLAYQKVEADNKILSKHISQTDTLFLNYNQTIWGISYDAICFNTPDAIQFSYKLKGFDNNWNFIGNKREITFTNIPAGFYELHVKAWMNNPNEAKEIILYVSISPPWWQTWWFRLLVVLGIIIILYTIYYIRTYSLQKQKIKLTQEVQKQTKELLEQKKELQQANTTKNYLFSIIAHDLRNSFTSLHGFSELLKRDYTKVDESKKREYVSLISQSSTAIYNLLENLLNWSRSQTSKINSNPEVCNIADIINHVLDVYALTAQEKQINIQITIPDSTYVFVDKEMIITSLRNIYNNSLKFTPQNGEIIFETKDYKNKVEIRIKDSGCGMSNEKLHSLFALQPFSQRKRNKNQGAGLGLIVCKEFIEMNKGSISVKSKEGEGTTFIISLPKV